MLPAVPQRTAAVRFMAPTPTTAPMMVWVVETGMPRKVAPNSATAPPVSAQKPWIGFRSVIFEPTVFTDVPPTSRLAREEPFGPIATIAPFDTLDEAIGLANDSAYGLGAYAFTRDLASAHRLGEEIEAGMVGINHFGVSQPEMPFGGWKESGHGQEMGAEGLLAYTDLKTVIVGAPQ